MRSIYTIALALFITVHLSAQQYSGSFGINSADSSVITALAHVNNGDMVTASLSKRVTISGATGMMDVGHMVLRRLEANGHELWKREFPQSIARINQIKIAPDGNIIVAGAFHDTLIIGGTQLYASLHRLNAFMASYSPSGNLNWVHATTREAFYSKYYYNFDIYNNLIYAPLQLDINTAMSFQVYNLQGDSIDQIPIADGALLISEMEFDAQGNLYICGTGDPLTKIAGHDVGTDTIIGYMSFIAKLNANFQHEWSYNYEYITFDYYPQMAIGNSEIAFIVDTIPQHNGIGNYHQLVFYSKAGQHLGRDSIGGGVFNPLHQNIALEYFDDAYVFVGLSGWDTLTVIKTDPQFNYTQLAKLNLDNFNSKPTFAKNGSILTLHLAFMDTIAIINDSDWVLNPKHTYPYFTSYQQLVVKFESDLTTDINDLSMTDTDFRIYPNPSADGILNMDLNHLDGNSVLQVYTMDGRLAYRKHINNNTQEFSIATGLSPGIYLVSISTGSKMQTKKWVIR